jgi:hypothetical protein
MRQVIHSRSGCNSEILVANSNREELFVAGGFKV